MHCDEGAAGTSAPPRVAPESRGDPRPGTLAGATPSNIARLQLLARKPAKAEDADLVVYGSGMDIRALAREVVRSVDQGIEAGAHTRLPFLRRRVLQQLTHVTGDIARDVVEQLSADADAGRLITRGKIREAVAAAVASAMEAHPSAFRTETLLGFGLFLVGLGLGGYVNVEIMSLLPATSTGTQLAIQTMVSTGMGYLLAIFNPYFNDKVSSASRALNYKIMDSMMRLLGRDAKAKETTSAIDPGIAAQLGEVYIAQQGVDGRLQGVLGLMIGFCSFIGESFYKARYILDDESNPRRLEDACDLMAGIFVTSRLVFYSLKPEQKDIFESYVYSVLQPTLRKHSSVRGEEMFELIMAKIRDSKPAPAEDTLAKYYEPFVRGALGLVHTPERDLMSEVKAVLGARELDG